MVYHEIALEPSSLEDLKDLGLLEKHFGFEQGRLIAFMPAKPKGKSCWWTQLYEHLKSITPERKHKELEVRTIKLLEQATYRSRNRSKMEEGKSWADLALEENGIKSFAAILCAGEPSESELLPFQGLHDPDERYPEFLTKPIHFGEAMKDPETFFESIRPLIASAIRIAVIDPHFDPSHPEEKNRKRWLRTARKLSEFLREANRLTIDISIHTQADGDRDPDEMVREISRAIDGLFPSTTNLEISAWSNKHRGPRMHARYLITDKAGVALDYGVDVSSDLRTDITLMPADKAKERLREFDVAEPSLYELEATFTAKGTRT